MGRRGRVPLPRSRARRSAGRPMVTLQERERRARAVAPLFTYLVEHGISASWLARQVGERLGVELFRQRMTLIKSGSGTAPRGFMPTACAVLGFADPAELLGAQWMAEFGWEYDCAPFPGLKASQPAA